MLRVEETSPPAISRGGSTRWPMKSSAAGPAASTKAKGFSSSAPPAMDQLTGFRIFTRVVELDSFSKAADDVVVSQSTVTKHIACLESHLGARLLNPIRAPSA
jgi:hypothetical protein